MFLHSSVGLYCGSDILHIFTYCIFSPFFTLTPLFIVFPKAYVHINDAATQLHLFQPLMLYFISLEKVLASRVLSCYAD